MPPDSKTLLEVLPEIKHDTDGSVWLQVPNAAINLSVFPPLTANALLAWAAKVEAVVEKVTQPTSTKKAPGPGRSPG